MAEGLKRTHWINVNSKGSFRQSGEHQTTPQDVDAIFASLRESKAKKMVVHFHGGLVNEKGGYRTAEALTPTYVSAGAHPVTFIWETGFFETIAAELPRIHQSELFRKILAIAARNVMKRLGIDVGGKGAAVPPELAQLYGMMDSADGFSPFDAAARGGAAATSEGEIEAREDDIIADVEADLDAELSTAAPPDGASMLKEELRAETAEGGRGVSLVKLAVAVGKVVVAVAKRYIRKTDHRFYPTLFEEILREVYLADFGGWVWGGMKGAAERMWASNAGLGGDDLHPGRYFLDGLSALQKETGIQVDLVGHSAGSIAIIHMLRTIESDYPAMKIRNLIFIAPACTSELFATEIVAKPSRFERFRMFTMSDDFEAADPLINFLRTSIRARCSTSSRACSRRRATRRSPACIAISPARSRTPAVRSNGLRSFSTNRAPTASCFR